VSRIFLLSPARCHGPRAALLTAPRAGSPLAERLRAGDAPLGEVFAFLSPLYFRGKLRYAERFARPPRALAREPGGVLVIAPGAGLLPPRTLLDLPLLERFGAVEVRVDNAAYRAPLDAQAALLADAIGPRCDVVLLGSIASTRYVTALAARFGERLSFPRAFVGRGDMSRGGLLLRAVEAGEELEYAPLAGTPLHGPRPPKLPPHRRR
jgi:hypothetical protein